ncbi:DNA repair protein rhp54 [Plakobranchus ocellatus]|uniref:DNA repair protein rhp54 n=1 Tax=Plakobranchus ocellatus TaxID=259542 RepID=A0AAV4AB09_9GAST|nr:DNA repair protein rhp54 [Plakobranchus ocellatus]
MYDLCREQCTERGLEPVKLHKYRQICNQQFNIRFMKPKSDRCDTCESHKMNDEKGVQSSEKDREAFARHTFLKDNAREARQRDRESSSAVLPRSNVSNFYYRRKLSVYNLTVHYSLDKSSYCCIWNEAEGGRCGNTIASALLKVLDQFTQENPTINNIILWSDSCVAQNRNSLMSYALLSFMRAHPHIKILTQKYSEAGHSLVQEVDSVHSAIECHLARCEVFSPVTLIRQLLSVRRNPKLMILQMKHRFSVL